MKQPSQFCGLCNQRIIKADPSTYGGKLKAWRIGRRMTQNLLAVQAGVSERQVQKWENSGVIPSRPIRILLAELGFNSNYVEGK